MNNCDIIFTRIDGMRKLRHLSVEEFTVKMGYNTKCVYYQIWKERPENIKIKHIIQAAEILGCTTDYLLGLTDEVRIA